MALPHTLVDSHCHIDFPEFSNDLDAVLERAGFVDRASEHRITGGFFDREVNTLLEAHIQQVEMRVSALLQLKRHLVDLREKCSGSRSVEACGILQGLGNCNCHGESATNSQTSG